MSDFFFRVCSSNVYHVHRGRKTRCDKISGSFVANTFTDKMIIYHPTAHPVDKIEQNVE